MARVPCEFCRRPIEHDGPTTFEYVTGWARNRKQGGTNALALRKTRNLYACSDCIDQLTTGLQDQPTMFD